MTNNLVDMAILEEMRDTTDPDFALELIDTYIDDSAELIEAMRSALTAGDADAFRRAAHSLKSNSATVGAAELSSMAKDLERMGRDGELKDAQPTMEAAASMFEQVREALERAKHDLHA
ncbi:MAG: Hpt domain-containing protein [Anaerolineales bacterium]